jgi:hypothetical protein
MLGALVLWSALVSDYFDAFRPRMSSTGFSITGGAPVKRPATPTDGTRPAPPSGAIQLPIPMTAEQYNSMRADLWSTGGRS